MNALLWHSLFSSWSATGANKSVKKSLISMLAAGHRRTPHTIGQAWRRKYKMWQHEQTVESLKDQRENNGSQAKSDKKRNVRARSYAARDREKSRAINRKSYRATTATKRTPFTTTYYSRHREKVKEAIKKWQAENPEHFRAYKREYRLKHLAEHQARERENYRRRSKANKALQAANILLLEQK